MEEHHGYICNFFHLLHDAGLFISAMGGLSIYQQFKDNHSPGDMQHLRGPANVVVYV